MAKIKTDDLPVDETLGQDEMREVRGGTTSSALSKEAMNTEEVRKKREQIASAFESHDQKASQLYKLMSSALKNINELRMSVTRNML